MAEQVKLIVDGAALEALRAPPNGMIFNYMIRTADKIIEVAKTKINRRFVGPTGPGGAGGGSLADSMVKRPVLTGAGLSITIVAMKPYSFWVHQGNGPPGAKIYPTKPGGVLAFAEPGGGMIFRRWVHTSKPNPYLRTAMEEVIASGDV
jgi:hypothetical protein